MDQALPHRPCLSVAEATRLAATARGAAPEVAALDHLEGCPRCQALVAEALHAPVRAVQGSLTSTFRPGQLVDGRYEIAGVIGRGGMGEVYEARDRLLGETVALKTLACGTLDDTGAIEQLKREVLLARRITHANVCRILEFGVQRRRRAGGDESVPFFTMELLRGETLTARLQRQGGLARGEVRSIALQLIDGLAAIHAAGVVHRDLKPENVFLVTKPAGGVRAVVMDLGLARPLFRPGGELSALATAPLISGTAGYMAPELRRGGEASVASDIYALGVVLLDLLGRTPRGRAGHTASAAGSGPPPNPPRALAAAWEGAIARCLDPRPSRRFRDVLAVRRALTGPWARVLAVPTPFLAGVGALAIAALAALGWPRLTIPGPTPAPPALLVGPAAPGAPPQPPAAPAPPAASATEPGPAPKVRARAATTRARAPRRASVWPLPLPAEAEWDGDPDALLPPSF